MKVRITGFLLVILVLLLIMVPAFAATVDGDEVSEEIDETEVIETEPEPEEEETVETPVSTSPFYLNGAQLTELVYQNVEGTYYVTVESFMTTMNAEAMVEEADGTVTVSAATVIEVVDVETEDTGVEMANVEEQTLSFTAEEGQSFAVANGRYLYIPDGVQMIDGKVAVPMRTLAEVFNLSVEYNAQRRVVVLEHVGEDVYLADGEEYYDEETLYWLSRIIYSESGNQPLMGKLAVGNVVMNRVASPAFPNTIKAVLFQKNQFSPASSGSIYREPNEESVIAAKLVMDGAVVLENALFFNRAGMNTFASRNRTYVATIGAHAFYS